MHDLTLSLADLAALAAEVLAQGGHFTFIARGSSMIPFIRTGDTLIVAPVDKTALQPGNVALYQPDDERLIAHRVVRREDDGGRISYKLRGDASAGPAEHVSSERIVGRVIRVVRGDKTIDLDRTIHRTAVALWIKMYPLGGMLLEVGHNIRSVARGVLVRLQASQRYRAIARTLMGSLVRYSIVPVRDGDVPGGAPPPLPAPQEPATPPSTSTVWVITARLAGVVCGVAALRISVGEGSPGAGYWFSDLRVRRIFRGAGIGAALVRRAMAQAAQAGAATMHLLVFEDNAVTMALYRKLGFYAADMSDLAATLDEEAQYTGRRRVALSVDLS